MPLLGRDADDDGSPALVTLGNHPTESRFVVRLFALAVGMFSAAAVLALLLTRSIPPGKSSLGTFIVPTAFAFSTALLLLCSVALEKARAAVRREKQRAFRQALLFAVACGTAFVGVQAFGLWCILQNLQADRNAGEAELGATAVALMFATLHACHVSVALMVLAYVTLKGLHDRYDHEYSFGVGVCAWFWHILAILWIFILGAYGIISLFLQLRIPTR